MTPRLFDALRKRIERRHQREEVLVGILASTIGNFSMGAPKTPFKPEDFVFTNPPRPIDQAPKQQSTKSMLAIFDRCVRVESQVDELTKSRRVTG